MVFRIHCSEVIDTHVFPYDVKFSQRWRGATPSANITVDKYGQIFFISSSRYEMCMFPDDVFRRADSRNIYINLENHRNFNQDPEDAFFST